MECLLRAECASFHIISGPNMAGKSTYLRQVAMIAVMAHAGCYVPAKFAALQIMDRLLTRLGSSDCIEHNSSSFLMEMQARPVHLFSQLHHYVCRLCLHCVRQLQFSVCSDGIWMPGTDLLQSWILCA